MVSGHASFTAQYVKLQEQLSALWTAALKKLVEVVAGLKRAGIKTRLSLKIN